jgi:5-methylcytosine-specific restriction endonuclease McrA
MAALTGFNSLMKGLIILVKVLAKDRTILQPTNRHGKVRRLLDNNKAEVVCKDPFTIRLLYKTKSKKTQKVKIYFDTGGKYQGFAIIANGKVINKGTIELRDGIPKLLKQRRQYRRGRRHRNKHYRQPRFDNRKKEKGWLPPSVRSKYKHILNWIDKLTKYLPDYELTVEVANFDIQKIKKPDIEGEEYQRGDKYGYENMKQYLIFRQDNKCQLCGKTKENDSWNLHHIISRKDGGTDTPDNLALLHSKCHKKLHSNNLDKELKKKVENLISNGGKNFKYTTFMNIIKNKLYNDLKNKYNDKVNFTYGYITHINRRNLDLSKTHYNDAIAMNKKPVENYVDSIYIKQVRKKKRSLHEAIPRAGRGNKINRNQKRNSKNTKQIFKNNKLWSLWDKVYISKLETSGFISGFTGKWIYVQDINGEYLQLPSKSYKQINPDSVKLICRNNNWIRKQIS